MLPPKQSNLSTTTLLGVSDILTIDPVNTPYQHTLSTHPINTPYQQTLSTCSPPLSSLSGDPSRRDSNRSGSISGGSGSGSGTFSYVPPLPGGGSKGSLSIGSSVERLSTGSVHSTSGGTPLNLR